MFLASRFIIAPNVHHRRMDTYIVVYLYNDSAVKRNELLIHTRRMNLRDTMLIERSQTQKRTFV